MGRKRLLWIDYPDILLLSTIIMVTKLLYPFSSLDEKMTELNKPYKVVAGRQPEESDTDNGEDEDDAWIEAQAFRMDWDRWKTTFDVASEHAPSSRRLNVRDIDNLQTSDAWTLTNEQIDDYLDWHQESRLSDKEGGLSCRNRERGRER